MGLFSAGVTQPIPRLSKQVGLAGDEVQAASLNHYVLVSLDSL